MLREPSSLQAGLVRMLPLPHASPASQDRACVVLAGMSVRATVHTDPAHALRAGLCASAHAHASLTQAHASTVCLYAWECTRAPVACALPCT